MSEEGNPASTASELIAIIKEEFKGVDRPVKAEELARLYGVIAAQHEANLACFVLTLHANPKLIFTDDAREAQRAIRATVSALIDALSDLAKASMSDEDREKIEGKNDT